MNDIDKILQDAEHKTKTATVASPDHEDLNTFIECGRKIAELAKRHNWPTTLIAFAPVAKDDQKGIAAVCVNHSGDAPGTFSSAGFHGIPLAMMHKDISDKGHAMSVLAEKILT